MTSIANLNQAFRNFNWKWFFKAAIAILVIAFVSIILEFSPFFGEEIYNMILFHPSKYPDGNYAKGEAAGISPKDIYFDADKEKLHGWLYAIPNSKYVCLLNHGNGGNLTYRLDIVDMLLRQNLSVFAYDYAGYGRSTGLPSMNRTCIDADAAYTYLVKELHYKPTSIILFGESFGTVIAGYLASHSKCSGVILQCPLYSIRRRGCEILSALCIYPAWTWPHNGMDNSLIFTKPHVPLLIISGTKDRMTPVAHADDLFKIASEPKMYARVEGGGHTGDTVLMSSPEYAQKLHRFLTILPN